MQVGLLVASRLIGFNPGFIKHQPSYEDFNHKGGLVPGRSMRLSESTLPRNIPTCLHQLLYFFLGSDTLTFINDLISLLET